MDSKAIAIVIIGVSIFVLVLSSAIGAPPDETDFLLNATGRPDSWRPITSSSRRSDRPAFGSMAP